jgi:hypothetical protein
MPIDRDETLPAGAAAHGGRFISPSARIPLAARPTPVPDEFHFSRINTFFQTNRAEYTKCDAISST